jgi:hypothetical protein
MRLFRIVFAARRKTERKYGNSAASKSVQAVLLAKCDREMNVLNIIKMTEILSSSNNISDNHFSENIVLNHGTSCWLLHAVRL